jgi:hypothetical protein
MPAAGRRRRCPGGGITVDVTNIGEVLDLLDEDR